MSRLPPEVLRVIELLDFRWTDHAFDEAACLELGRDDVLAVARSAETWKRSRDPKHEALDGYVHAFTGRNGSGRLLYVAGKRIRYHGEECWYVVTFHETRG